MFGIGGSEVIVILIVALIFLGPDKLPQTAKHIAKGVRELKKGSRVLQETIENDEQIGGAIRDIRGALRGEDPRPRPKKKKKKVVTAPAAVGEPLSEPDAKPLSEPLSETEAVAEATSAPALRLSDTAGEADPDVKDETTPEELAALIKPAEGTVPKGSSEPN